VRHDKLTPHPRSIRSGERRGITVLEVAASAMLLGVVVTTAAQLVQWSVALHQAALKRRCALEAATTVLDRITSRDWSAINSQTVKDTPLPPETKEFLGSPLLSATVTDESTTDKAATNRSAPNAAGRLRSNKVSVEISWGQRDDKQTQKVQLTTWVFEPGTAK
jgi:Tfp pilus assembly protein PilV